MGKNKLAKFADMETYPHVFEYPFGALQETPFPLKGAWHNAFFHNTNPIVLELGCGRGEYTVGLGRLHPDKNFIGVDIKGARMWTGATESLREGMTNVAFVRTHIELIDHFFAPGEVAEIWLTFCDPQMKKATKRLTSSYFLERYRRFLTDGGRIHLKTDSPFLYTYTRYLLEANGIVAEADCADIYATTENETIAGIDAETADALRIQTYYEQQWRARGLTIRYLRFRLPQEGALQEPDVEIELDSYRSYNRSKRSGLQFSK